MAHVRDSDTSLWLHNKLGTSNDLWNGGSICSQFNQDVLRNIRECFIELQSQVKLKLLLSFLHIPRRNVEEWKCELEEIVEVGLVDGDQWVSLLSELLRHFPASGLLNYDVSENATVFTDVVQDLRRTVRAHGGGPLLPPLECLYLNRSALAWVVGGPPPHPPKHFALRQKPKSATLRAELLQKSVDASTHAASAPSVPIRCRGLIKTLNDTTPLRGIPSSRLALKVSPRVGCPPSRSPRTPAGRKDGGIKLLEIDEQPMGPNKRRKKMPDAETPEGGKKEKEGAPSTPDYAAGLLATSQISAPSMATPPFPSPAAPPAAPVSVPASPAPPLPPPPVVVSPVAPPAAQPQQQIVYTAQPQVQMHTIVQAPAPPQKKGLSLTKEQMQEAQDMFNKSNRVTRPEKALILGFIAGSRDNPCPHLGQIVTIMLSEEEEKVLGQDGHIIPMVVETHFQMNYSTGEWKRVKKYKRIPPSS
ncbi:hypothetical protein JTE90_018734 [Oedothorax gibbosus]|uniref:HDAg domain-containing protein n=1 Tax=Oedothorax gibbosus TaxID=931172 RepID=A0AAV6UKV6_9ARAC|nr:hypothetical protein JTE90_018734 [Oedothorax gibbosus]